MLAKHELGERKRDKKSYVKSMVSDSVAESNNSKTSRSTNGRFEGSTKFGGNLFKKKGINSAGTQKWECLECAASTVVPVTHYCRKK